MNALTWFKDFGEDGQDSSSLFSNFAALGHHVYIGNTRGTEFSMRHNSLDYQDSIDAEDYWNFTYQDMYKDTIANGEAMMANNSGTEKGIYIGNE